MELLLNLFWLLLALSALAILRRQPSCALNANSVCRPRLFLLLGCLLALLFPVVSATDDLHPINQEIEDSVSSKHAVKQSPGGRSHSCGNHAAPSVQSVCVVPPQFEVGALLLPYVSLPPRNAFFSAVQGRAPPAA